MKYDLKTTDNGEFLLVMQGDEIIAHLPLKEKTALLNVDLLPPLPQVEDVEKLANDYINICYGIDDHYAGVDFIAGYNKAKETCKYTEEDLRNAFHTGRLYMGREGDTTIEQFMQSLQQPKLPIVFECETETLFVDGFTEDRVRRFYGNPEPKTITNSQGQTEWVGKYIYE